MFLLEPRAPLLIDLGSMCGTYIKASHEFPSVLAEGDCYLVGSDIIVEIDKLENDPMPASIPSDVPYDDINSMTISNEDLITEE